MDVAREERATVLVGGLTRAEKLAQVAITYRSDDLSGVPALVVQAIQAMLKENLNRISRLRGWRAVSSAIAVLLPMIHPGFASAHAAAQYINTACSQTDMASTVAVARHRNVFGGAPYLGSPFRLGCSRTHDRAPGLSVSDNECSDHR